jgi:hypothetical protein
MQSSNISWFETAPKRRLLTMRGGEGQLLLDIPQFRVSLLQRFRAQSLSCAVALSDINVCISQVSSFA